MTRRFSITITIHFDKIQIHPVPKLPTLGKLKLYHKNYPPKQAKSMVDVDLQVNLELNAYNF